MIRLIAEGLWRIAVLAALCWIGWELQRFHDDMMLPLDDAPTASMEPDALQDSLDAVRDDLAELSQKVDAILLGQVRTR